MNTLAADVGGTNTSLGIVNEKGTIVYIEKHPTPRSDFTVLVEEFLSRARRKVRRGCIAVAGPINKNRVRMTNSPLVIDAARIQKKTGIQVTLINDFAALAYATQILKPKDKVVLRKGTKEPAAIVGVGTGLGTSFLINDRPIQSEAGHMDYAPTTDEEFALAKALAKEVGTVQYEHLLSGSGLERMYRLISGEARTSQEIITTQTADARKTRKLFVQALARFSRAMVLVSNARSLYLAGGVLAHNSDLLGEEFLREFVRTTPQYSEILSKVGITIITNYDISVAGAAQEVNQ